MAEVDQAAGEGTGSVMTPAASLEEVCKDQLSWAQSLLEVSYFESCFSPGKSCAPFSPGKSTCFSPRTFSFSPRGDQLQSTVTGGGGGTGAGMTFPDLGAFCPSPLLSDQLKIVHNWSSMVSASAVSKPAEEAVSTTSVSSRSESDDQAGTAATTTTSAEEVDKQVGSELTMGCWESGVDGGTTDTKASTRKRRALSEEDDGSLATEEKNSSEKRVKVKGPKRMREPRYAIKTRSDVDIMEDGYKWRKYGQKPVKSSPHPRNYYRCTTANCPVRKRVERCTEDTGLVITSYEGTHSHPKVVQEKIHTTSGLSERDHDLNMFDGSLGRGATAGSLLPSVLSNLGHLWGGSPVLDFPGSWPQQAPSVHDNLSLIMAFQLVKLQWELQARTKQFMDYNSAQIASAAAAQGGPAFSDPSEMMSNTYMANCTDSGTLQQLRQAGQQFLKPELPMSNLGSSLLRKRASAFRNGGPIPLDLQSIAKTQQLKTAQLQNIVGQPHSG